MWSGKRRICHDYGGNGGFICEINSNHAGVYPQIFFFHRHGMHSAVGDFHAKQHKHTKDFELHAMENSYGLTKIFHLRPLLLVNRATYIMAEVTMLSIWHFLLKDVQKRAEKLRCCLIRLGPFYIKLGQALSTRPDMLPSAYCQELAKLQDQIPPFRTSIALRFMESQLGSPAHKLFAEISPEPVAAASLGQVYKARLHSGELVAVKVQRPGMQSRLALDSSLLHIVGGQLQRFLGARGDVVAALNEMVGRMFEEIDYVKEGLNAERFAALYGGISKNENTDFGEHIKTGDRAHRFDHGRRKRRRVNSQHGENEELVKVPKIHWNYSSKGVLTMEWIDGIKLTDTETLGKLNFNIQHLVDQGVFCSLRQLLEEGFFHADPHPGNLVVTKEGKLAYFDFGMMGDFPRHYRIGLIRTLVHFVNRDSIGLANDFFGLGFIPEEENLEEISHALHASFGDESSKAQLDFQGIMNQLSNVMHEFKFTLPPEYALVIRALGSLEGTATLLDPEFKVVASAYPFIIGRLLADPDPDMRQILRELLIRNNGSIRWQRLERLVVAIAEQSSTEFTSGEAKRGGTWTAHDGLGTTAGTWGSSFDTRTVVSATADLLQFVLSEQGYRVRVLLVQDIVKTFNLFFDENVWSHINPDGQKLDYRTSVKKMSEEHSNCMEDVYKDPGSSESAGAQEEINKYTKVATQHGHRPNATVGTVTYQQSKARRNDSEQSSDFGSRVLLGIRAFKKAVESAPELWISLLARFAAKPEAQAFAATVIASLLRSVCSRSSETMWLLLSRMIHDMHCKGCKQCKSRKSC